MRGGGEERGGVNPGLRRGSVLASTSSNWGNFELNVYLPLNEHRKVPSEASMRELPIPTNHTLVDHHLPLP